MSESFESEIRKYTEQLAKDAKSRAFVPLSDIYRKLGRYDESIAVALEGLKYHPNYIGAKTVLARAYFENGDSDAAQELLEETLQFSPDNILANKILSQIYYQKGVLDKSIPLLRQLLSIDPNDAYATKQLKDIENKKTETKKETYATEVHIPKPQFTNLSDKTEIVIKQQKTAETSSPHMTQTPTLAMLYRSQGHFEQALEIYKELFKSDPKNSVYTSSIHELELELEKKKHLRKIPMSKITFLESLISQIKERRREL